MSALKIAKIVFDSILQTVGAAAIGAYVSGSIDFVKTPEKPLKREACSCDSGGNGCSCADNKTKSCGCTK